MLSRTNLRRALFAGVAMAAVISTAAAAQTGPVNFDIASGDLGQALGAYAKQSGVELFYQSRVVAGRSTQGLHGSFAPREGLNELLKGTGLVLAMDQSGAMVVREASAPQSGSAAGDGADQGTVAALVVTAQKREENIQDVPIAMSAFTQEDLTRSQVAGGPDLMTQVPNFTFTKTNFTGYSIQIRGIGTQAISATVDPAVAVAFNNTPFIRNRFFEQEFYDLERVEVLRGPQGTLYGRNATGGVVNIISTKPKFGYEARLSADLGNYNSQRLEGMVNVPLVEDKVALRLAGAWTKRDGYDTNQITGNRIDGRDLWSTRLSLRVEPTDHFKANLIWEHFEENDDRLRSGKQLCHADYPTELGGFPVYDGWTFGLPVNPFSQGCLPSSLYSPDSFETPNGDAIPYFHPLAAIGLPIPQFLNPYADTTQSKDLRVIESTVDPRYSAETDTVELQFRADLSSTLTLTSETGYLSDSIFSLEDYNRFNTRSGVFDQAAWDLHKGWGDSFYRENMLTDGVFCDPQIGCADRLVAVDTSTAKSTQFSQELRLSSSFDGTANFSLGMNFLRYDTEDKYYVFVNTLTLFSLLSPYHAGSASELPPYLQGVSDNHECMTTGLRPGDPRRFQSLALCTYVDPNLIGSLNDLGHNYFLSKNPYKLTSYAIFGEAYYDITPVLKLTAGLRWTVDKKEAPRVPSWLLSSATVGYPVLEVIRQKWSEPTGRLTLDWKPGLSFTDETLIYGSLAHGYKAGGANPPPTGYVMWAADPNDPRDITGNGKAAQGLADESATHPKIFKPEFVNALEVGTKNTLLDGALTLNADTFFYDYKGYQISQIIDRSAINYNFDAKVWGVEIEANWLPIENLRLGFKGGYENTSVADGMSAVDVMDRTAGHSDWVVLRPFPTFPSNCILPVAALTTSGGFGWPGPEYQNGNIGLCEVAYVYDRDPATNLPYVANPTERADDWRDGLSNRTPYDFGSYGGFNPETAPNHGAGFSKDLGGNELPNAPHFTASMMADYTLPLANDWLMTLHTDLYYQSEAWTRIFNTPGYDKLKAYTNVNLAAILSNEDAGWKVMAYVKNVFDRDSVTGAFLNSDDTGLTTNVFLTDPRLYGLRVTKEWNGGRWSTGANRSHTGPYPLTVEVGGDVQRQDANFDPVGPSSADVFSAALRPANTQGRDLDWGDGREVRIRYQPEGSSWNVAAGFRYGKANTGLTRLHAEEAAGPKRCVLPMTGPSGAFGKELCDPDYVLILNGYEIDAYNSRWSLSGTNWSDATGRSREEHEIADFQAGRDFGLGMFDTGASSLAIGLRAAKFESTTDAFFRGIPDWQLPEAWGFNSAKHHRYESSLTAKREFEGAGPTVSWTSGLRLWGDENTGRVDVDWTAAGGVLFGKQKTAIKGVDQAGYFVAKYPDDQLTQLLTPIQVNVHRDTSVTVPVLDLSLGLSYDLQRVKLSTGYHWERYYNVLDAGNAEHKSYDRTIDGPYFKIAVGFGG